MDPISILGGLLVAGLAAGLVYMLRKLKKDFSAPEPGVDPLQDQNKKKSESEEPSTADSGEDGSVDPEQKMIHDLSRKLADVDEFDQFVKKGLQSAFSNSSPRDLDDRAALEEMLRKLPLQVLQALDLASSKELVILNLSSKKKLKRSLPPGNRVDREPITELDEIDYSDPVEFLVDDNEFYRKFADGELTKQVFFEIVSQIKQAELIIDSSGSMQQSTKYGYPRYVVAIAIAIQLLQSAQKKQAKFMLRLFDSRVYDLWEVTTPQEAELVLVKLLQLPFSGGGTDIMLAIQTAVGDIDKSVGKRFATREIVLITDAEEELSEQQLRTLLGDKFVLHSVVIGNSSGTLKRVSKSYLLV